MDATTNEAAQVRFLGWTDEVDACDLCGKTGLKSTAALEIDGETVYFGCVCAARTLSGRFGQKISAAKIQRETEAAHDLQVKCGEALDRGLYEPEWSATVQAMKAIDPAISWFMGTTTYGLAWASQKLGKLHSRRFESRDVHAVAAWVLENQAAEVASRRTEIAERAARS